MPNHGREFGEIPTDEPCFFIRGQDRAAPAALRFYVAEARRLGASPDLVLSVQVHAAAIEQFQAAHGSKVPDLG